MKASRRTNVLACVVCGSVWAVLAPASGAPPRQDWGGGMVKPQFERPVWDLPSLKKPSVVAPEPASPAFDLLQREKSARQRPVWDKPLFDNGRMATIFPRPQEGTFETRFPHLRHYDKPRHYGIPNYESTYRIGTRYLTGSQNLFFKDMLGHNRKRPLSDPERDY